MVREHLRGENASEAGSSWQSDENGGGFLLVKAGALVQTRAYEGALVDGRHSESGKPFRLTKERRKRLWYFAMLGSPGGLRGATGSVRGRITSLACG